SPAVRPAGPPPMMMRSRSVSSGILSGRSSPRLEQLIIPERFLALGDSFTIGTGTTPDRSFPALLARIWTERGRKVVLANPAVNGYTTDDLISDELPLISSFHPTLITVLVGANDIVRGDSEGRYRRQLRSIYERIRVDAADARVIALPQPDWSLSPAGSRFGDGRAMVRASALTVDMPNAVRVHADGLLAGFGEDEPQAGWTQQPIYDSLHFERRLLGAATFLYTKRVSRSVKRGWWALFDGYEWDLTLP